MRWPPLLIFVTLLLPLPALAAVDPCGKDGKDAQGPRALAEEGLRLYKAAASIAESGERVRTYERALRCYQQALKSGQQVDALYHPLGLVYEKLERPVEAIGAFERFLAAVPEIERRPGVTKQIQDKLKVLLSQVSRLDIIAVKGAEVRIDQQPVGQAPLGRLVLVLPGAHSISATATGPAGTQGADVVAEAGQVRRIDLTPTPPQQVAQAPLIHSGPGQAAKAPETTPTYRRWWLWTLVGVAAAGAATGIALGTTYGRAGEAPLPEGLSFYEPRF